ncbi:msx2-interacting protein-like isoform X2 [Ranitomeya variabilis]|uniref:msx2-interacting protein-like isoform X2 n=1 Tax=Ranitomeya variabilis TaxID=490064 RepID=UPI004056DB7E
MVGETRHLWVGNLPENVREDKIREHFRRYGHIENVTILPKRGARGGVAAFVDFATIASAHKAHNAVNKMGDRELRTDYNTPGTVRDLDEKVSTRSRRRAVSGIKGGGGGPAYSPPQSRRLDGASDTSERSSGHHEWARHFYLGYYPDPLGRTLHGISSNSSRSPSRTDSSRKARSRRPKRKSRRSRSPHSSQSRSRSPHRRASRASRSARSPSGSWSRSSSSDSFSSRSTDSRRSSSSRSTTSDRDIYRTDASRKARGRRPKRNYQHSRSRSPHSSQSRNQSPQRLASQASRPARSPSGSGSRSRSSSSDSLSSSTSSDSDSSSTSSDESPARSARSRSSMDKDEPHKSFGIKVQNLPVRSSDSSLKDGLYHEFKKYGTVNVVQLYGASTERYGLVFFRQQEDQEKALNASKGKLFFGMKIEVTAWEGPETECKNEFRPFDERIEEFHHKATRFLFIGNLEKTTTHLDIRNVFQRFGGIVDIDVKMVDGVPQYAFLQYCDITSVCKAIKKMDGEYLGNNRLKLNFGKSVPTNCVWIDGLPPRVTEQQYLNLHFSRYGTVLKVVVCDRSKGMALILYSEMEFAETAVKETKGRKIGGNVVKVDFAIYEKEMAFYGLVDSAKQDLRDFHGIISEGRSDETPRGSFHELPTTWRTYYDSARTAATYQEETRKEYPAQSREFCPELVSYPANYYQQRNYDESREDTDLRDPCERARTLQAITPRAQPLLGEATVGQVNTIYYSLLSAIAGRRQ